jgi:hypothetical protein
VTGGVPAAVGGLEQGAREATEEAGSLQRGGSYNAGPVTLQTIGATVAPIVGPARGLSALGAGLARPAARTAAELTAAERAFALPDAPFPQYTTQYPAVGPPVEKTFKNVDKATGEITYKTGPSKQLTPEAKQFMKERSKIVGQMETEGYTPYFDPAKRDYVDPSKYPAANVDTLTIMPKSGTPSQQKTFNEYLKNIDTPATRDALKAAYDRGIDLGNAEHWYAMSQLEKEYTKELGATAGRKAFLDEFAVPMAITTSGADPQANFLMAQYLEHARKTGLPIPAEAHQLPATVGGRYGGTNLQNYQLMREGGGYSYLGQGQPKMHNFARSFLGDLGRAVMDEQMAIGMVGKKFADKARDLGFGLLERPVHELAAAKGVQPGNIQDVAWAGFKNEPGKPMISFINDAIERTHRLTGMPRDEIVRRGLVRKEIPIYSTGAVPVPTIREE